MPVVTAADPKATQVIGENTTVHTQAPLPTTPTRQIDKREETQAPEDTMAPQLAKLAQQERMFREQQRTAKEALAAERAAFAQEKAEAEKVKAWKGKFGEDPWSALIEAGYSPEQATELMLNQPKAQDVQLTRLQQELLAVKQAQEQTQTQLKQAEQLRYEQAKKQIGNEVKLLVDSDVQFETIKAMDAQDAVTELIEQTFNDEGILMSISEAADAVETYLVEEAYRLSQLKKVQSRLNVQSPQLSQAKTQPVSSQKTPSPMTTLTHGQTVSPSKPMTARERAIAAFMGNKT